MRARANLSESEHQAWVTLYDEGVAEVYGYLLHRGGDHRLARELTREVFLSLARETRGHPAPEPSLDDAFRRARMLLIGHWHRSEGWGRRERDNISANDDDGRAMAAEVADDGPTLIDDGRAMCALHELGANYRTALVLRHIDGLTVPEVARMLDTTVVDAEALMAQARKRFRLLYAASVVGAAAPEPPDPLLRLRPGPTPAWPDERFSTQLRADFVGRLGKPGLMDLRVPTDVMATQGMLPTDPEWDLVDIESFPARPDGDRRWLATAVPVLVAMTSALVGAAVARSAESSRARAGAAATNAAAPASAAPTPRPATTGMIGQSGAVETDAARSPTNATPIEEIARAFDDLDAPTFLTIDGDSVWIQHDRGPIERRNKHTGDVTGLVPMRDSGSKLHSRLAVAFGSLWLAQLDSTIARIDPESGLVLATIVLPDRYRPVRALADLVVGDDALWTLSGDDAVRSIYRIDPLTNSVSVVPVSNDPIYPTNVALVHDELWVVYQGSREIRRVRANDMRSVGSVELPFAAWTLLTTPDAGVWVVNRDVDHLAQVDPHRGRVVVTVDVGPKTYAVGRYPEIAYGGGFVWEATAPLALLTQIDPVTHDVVGRFQAAHPGGDWGLAADDEAVWVSSRADGKVYRVPLDR